MPPKPHPERRLYYIWEKFIAREWSYVGEKQFGGFDYEISGDEVRCYQNTPIILKSQEFKDFWKSYNLHGLICLSDYGCPFPELEQTGEGHQFRSRINAKRSVCSFSDKVQVSQEVHQGLVFLKKELTRQQLSNLNDVDTKLRRYGHKHTADWIKQYPKEYMSGLRLGFDTLQDR
jgi:hypothetical protein